MAQTNADLIWKIADLFARPVSAQSVRRCDLAVHHPAPFGLHPGADQGPSPRRVQEGAEPEDRPRCCAQVHVQAARVVVLATAAAKTRGTRWPRRSVSWVLADDGLGPDPGRIADIECRVWRWRRWLLLHRNYE